MFAYLLGLYLGDGWIAEHKRGVYRLRITLDRRYQQIVRECARAMRSIVPSGHVSVYPRRGENTDEVSSYWKHWPCMFPQHGEGAKHNRRIILAPWQREITDRHPREFLRGLIHSDGCRTTNTIRHPNKVYFYPRYFFTNRSDDIRDLFCSYCEMVGIEWRQNNRFDVSIARRESVAMMDRFIGVKR